MLEPSGVSNSLDVVIESGTTLRDAVVKTTRFLKSAGIVGAAGDARILTVAASSRRAVELITDPEAKLSHAAASLLAEMAGRRARHEPVSRILGAREFYGRVFEITPATLDPRPDTETLVDAALEVLKENAVEADAPLRLLDIGTGSGCLIVTLLAELPAATGLATDISSAALAVALRNAERHGVADRLRLRRCDLLDEVEGRYNLLVSNPPYIATGKIEGLDEEVASFDPQLALDGGPDGLGLYRRLAARLGSVLAQSPSLGWAFFEVGAGQAEDIARILHDSGFGSARTWMDLGGHTRCVAVGTLR